MLTNSPHSQRVCRLCLLVWLGLGGTLLAQTSKSADLAGELAKLLDSQGLDTIAANSGSEPDRFVAALYFPGQLLVVSAKYAVPQLLVGKLKEKAYRDVYLDLNGASAPDSRIFITDVGADGLTIERDGGADRYERGGTTAWIFNGDWRAQKIGSADEYRKNYAAADAEYAGILTALIQQAKRPS